MANVLHSSITDAADLHEPKGATTASDGEVYVADGAGSGAFTDIQPLIGVPVGASMWWWVSSVPTGWLEMAGQNVSRTTYATLFSVYGTTYGVGDGSTTFGLPDTRGEFIRGWDHSRGVDVSRALGSAQDEDIVPHVHTVDPPSTSTSSDNEHDHDVSANRNTNYQLGGGGGGLSAMTPRDTGNSNSSSTIVAAHDHTVDIAEFDSGSTGTTETRPRNLSAMMIVKY